MSRPPKVPTIPKPARVLRKPFGKEVSHCLDLHGWYVCSLSQESQGPNPRSVEEFMAYTHPIIYDVTTVDSLDMDIRYDEL